MSQLYPLLFEPVLKHYRWGGRNLERLFGRDLPGGVTAESWEIAGHRDGMTLVVNGPLAGTSLSELHARYGLELIGHNSSWAQRRDRFPLLVKLLDANRPLSVQVHPTDEYAAIQENDELGKSEMWIVLHAEPEAELILGVTKGTTAANFENAIGENDLDRRLHRLHVSAGDFVCVPSGSLHAILGGIVLAEIQQNSNVTYRVYDWGRVDKNRPLHIELAMNVINFSQVEPQLPTPVTLISQAGVKRELLCRNKYFTVERLDIAQGHSIDGTLNGATFEIWGLLDGSIRISSGGSIIDMPALGFVLLPAALGRYRIEADYPSQLIRTFVEDVVEDD
jgi:mannose-6-phosphate isomerase